MQTVVLFLIILVCFNFILKQTYRKWYSVATISVLSALFVGFSWPYAIEQSKLQINAWLNNNALMLDTAVVLSVDVVMQIAFCLLAVRVQNSGQLNRYVLAYYRFMRWFPGIMIFPVLFSALVATIFAFPGTSFQLVAWSLAAVVGIAIPVASFLTRKLLPEKEIRLELLFMTNVLIAVLGVISTVNGHTNVTGNNSVDLVALGGILALVAAGAVAGLLIYRKRNNKLIKNLKS